MQPLFSLSFLTCLDAPPPAAIRTAAETGYDAIGLRLLPAMQGGIAFRLMDDAPLLRETLDALRDFQAACAAKGQTMKLKPEGDSQRIDAYACERN